MIETIHGFESAFHVSIAHRRVSGLQQRQIRDLDQYAEAVATMGRVDDRVALPRMPVGFHADVHAGECDEPAGRVLLGGGGHQHASASAPGGVVVTDPLRVVVLGTLVQVAERGVRGHACDQPGDVVEVLLGRSARPWHE